MQTIDRDTNRSSFRTWPAVSASHMYFCIRVSVTLDAMETAPTRPLTVSPLVLTVLQAEAMDAVSESWPIKNCKCWQTWAWPSWLAGDAAALAGGARQTHVIVSLQPSSASV